MTEPEELDEDLFADLYDGDDASTQPNQSTKVEASQAVTLLLTEQKMEAMHDGPMLDVKEEPPSTSLFIEQHDVDHGMNDTNSSDWQNGQGGGDNEGHDYGHATTDQVSHGTGIKEDGFGLLVDMEPYIKERSHATM